MFSPFENHSPEFCKISGNKQRMLKIITIIVYILIITTNLEYLSNIDLAEKKSSRLNSKPSISIWDYIIEQNIIGRITFHNK